MIMIVNSISCYGLFFFFFKFLLPAMFCHDDFFIGY